MKEDKKKPTVEDYNNENTIKFNARENNNFKKDISEDEEEVQYVKPTKDNKKGRRKLLIFLFLILFIIVIFLGISKYQIYKENKAMEDLLSYNVVDLFQIPIQEDVSSSILTNDTASTSYSGQVIGYIQIPSIDMKVPVYQSKSGDEQDMEDVMNYTVAHDPDTLLPGEEQKSVFTGHREEQFGKLKDIEKDDLIIVTIGDNTFLYQVDELKIGDADDQEIIDYVYNYNNVDELVLYTCYPFRKYAPVKQRFIVHAKRISSYDKPIDVRVEEDKNEE